jgi:hypothetical protein
MIGVVVSMILTSVAVKYLLRRHHFKHLEERLMSSDDDIGEDGDHYFVMRLPDHEYVLLLVQLIILRYKILCYFEFRQYLAS